MGAVVAHYNTSILQPLFSIRMAIRHSLLFILVMLSLSVRSFIVKSPFKPRTMALFSTSTSLDQLSMLISVDDAIALHSSPLVKFVDGSWFLAGRNGRQEWEDGPRIPGSVYFDIDDVASKGPTLNPNNIKHQMPPPQLFAAAMDAMDITNDQHLIVYGSESCMCTARTYYQLKAMGHDSDKVHLMQGSLQDWIDKGGPVDTSSQTAIVADELDLSKPATYTATEPRNVVNLEEMKSIVESQDAIVIDVRANDRFLGEVDEPRPGLRLGHMPGALNLPFINMLDSNMQYKPREEMVKLFEEAGVNVDSEKQIVVSCGSGVTACVVASALEACGRDPSNTFVYDGSWMEWGGQPDTPIVTGKDE